MSLKIAIVGCGKIADAHVEEVRKIANAELVAVCDLESIMAEQLAARYGIPFWYSDFTRMLNEREPHVVHLTTPPQSHLVLVREALAAGCHIFLEKPVAPRHEEVKAIVAAVNAAGRKLAVNYWPNFEDHALELRELIKSGIIGEVVHLESYYGYDLSGEYGMALRRDPQHWVNRLPGKLLQNILDHVLNKIVLYLPDDRPFIHALAYQGVTGKRLDGDSLLDELRVIIQGEHTSAYATFSAHARPVGHSLRIHGTRNTASVDYMTRTLTLERKQPFPSALGRLAPPFIVAKDYFQEGLSNVNRFLHARFHYFHGMRRLLTEFYKSIEDDSASPVTSDEILRVSAMMETIFQQVYPEVLA